MNPEELFSAISDRYRLREEIGAGGMATVYLAEDVKHGRSVAVKVLRPELAGAVGPERFLREIEIAAALTHPHVLPLHDSGREGEWLYYVMPYLDGASLRERLVKGSLPVPVAVRLFRQVLDALGAAHRQGVVHRDVKPGNILLKGDHAWVADFGVARAVGEAIERERLTRVGGSVGTPQYMAPEQAVGDPSVDHRADLFSAGAVMYEMLTGSSPFGGESDTALISALLTKQPTPPSELRPDVPKGLSDLVMRCLAKERRDRPESVIAVLRELDALGPHGVPESESEETMPLIRYVALVVVALLGALAMTLWPDLGGRRVGTGLDADVAEVLNLVESNEIAEAARAALAIEARYGPQPLLEPVWPRMASPIRVDSEPPGARIRFRSYGGGEWSELGVTPFENDRFPVGAYRFALELDGYRPVEKVRSFIPRNQLVELARSGMDYLEDASYVIQARLSPSDDEDDGMTHVSGGLYGTVPVVGFGTVEPRIIPGFWIDRTEVDNRSYQEFVSAGGYEDLSLWSPQLPGGEGVSGSGSPAERFVDQTGRTGPAGWTLGRPPQGADDLPVGGVSWFEADAYCRWKGLHLPTLFHWARATLPSTDIWIPFNPLLLQSSNFDDAGPRAVGNPEAVGISGAFDLGGNVREWVSTGAGADRLLLGGGWNDPVYRLHDPAQANPLQRDAQDGFRCVRYETPLPEALGGDLTYPEQDLARPASMSDEDFEALRVRHSYDRAAPLDAVIDSTAPRGWGARVEWLTVNSAYGERMPIRIHAPAESSPPFPALVFFGGGNVIRSREMEDPQPPLDQLVRAGYVLVEPAYDGTFQRNDGRTLARLAGPEQGQIFSNWVKDLGRTLDYLESRADVDSRRVSFVGISLGASIAQDLLPFLPRFSAAVLYSGGLGVRSPQPALDRDRALAARVQVPVLMLGGRNDHTHPVTHQEALFQAFGAAPAEKRFRIFEAGHWPLPMGEVLRETVEFLEGTGGR